MVDDRSEASRGYVGPMTQGADFLRLDVREVPPGGRTAWLVARIRQAIAEGTVGVGTRLRPTRVLATELGLVASPSRRWATTVPRRARSG